MPSYSHAVKYKQFFAEKRARKKKSATKRKEIEQKEILLFEFYGEVRLIGVISRVFRANRGWEFEVVEESLSIDGRKNERRSILVNGRRTSGNNSSDELFQSALGPCHGLKYVLTLGVSAPRRQMKFASLVRFC